MQTKLAYPFKATTCADIDNAKVDIMEALIEAQQAIIDADKVYLAKLEARLALPERQINTTEMLVGS
jgi:hypothetical protein